MRLNVWNVSLYYGLSYSYPSFNALETLKTGMVVILNTPFHRDDAQRYMDGESFYAVDYLNKATELFESAQYYRIRTYIVNANPLVQNSLLSERLQPRRSYPLHMQHMDWDGTHTVTEGLADDKDCVVVTSATASSSLTIFHHRSADTTPCTIVDPISNLTILAFMHRPR